MKLSNVFSSLNGYGMVSALVVVCLVFGASGDLFYVFSAQTMEQEFSLLREGVRWGNNFIFEDGLMLMYYKNGSTLYTQVISTEKIRVPPRNRSMMLSSLYKPSAVWVPRIFDACLAKRGTYRSPMESTSASFGERPPKI